LQGEGQPNRFNQLSTPARLSQVAETLPEEVLAKMHAPPKKSHPIIDPHTLADADAFIFGFPTRFGTVASQFKHFIDATGGRE
jgi:NAD(P)H dehydrogenase (quinone)